MAYTLMCSNSIYQSYTESTVTAAHISLLAALSSYLLYAWFQIHFHIFVWHVDNIGVGPVHHMWLVFIRHRINWFM